MGNRIVVSGAAFDNYVDRPIPYTPDGYYLFGTDEASSIPNLGSLGGSLTANGSPTYGEGYAQFPAGSNANYFDTGYNTVDGQTYVVVTTLGTYGYLIGQAEHILGFYNNGGGMRASGARGGVTTLAGNRGAGFLFSASSCADASGSPFKLYTAAGGVVTETSSATTNTIALPSGGPVKIGPYGNFGGTVGGYKVAAALIYNSQLTLAQIEELYDFFRFKLPSRGITVV